MDKDGNPTGKPLAQIPSAKNNVTSTKESNKLRDLVNKAEGKTLKI